MHKITAWIAQLGDAHPSRHELLEWHLSSLTTNDIDQLQSEMRVVQLVLAKLINEGRVLELPGETDDQPARLFLHPDFDPDS